jgi:hypothetical protein
MKRTIDFLRSKLQIAMTAMRLQSKDRKKFIILSVVHWFFVAGSITFYFVSLSHSEVAIYIPLFIVGMLLSWDPYESSLSNVQKRLITNRVLHWFFLFAFISFYIASFYQPRLLVPMIIISAIGMISWIPYNDCPLHVWENNLRKRLNMKQINFFAFNPINRLLGGKLPQKFTLYVIVAGLFVRLVV